MREGLTVGRSLPSAAIVRLGWGVVDGRMCDATPGHSNPANDSDSATQVAQCA